MNRLKRILSSDFLPAIVINTAVLVENVTTDSLRSSMQVTA